VGAGEANGGRKPPASCPSLRPNATKATGPNPVPTGRPLGGIFGPILQLVRKSYSHVFSMDQARLAPHRLLGTLAITLTILSVGERMSALDIRRIQGALIDVMISHRLQDALVKTQIFSRSTC
jgi:hypothetical protein